jgi:uncharacterized protein with PIN domain
LTNRCLSWPGGGGATVTLDVVAQARSVRLRLSGELWLFVAPRHRLEQVEIHHDGTATLGHLVEALGVPLTEVGALLAGSVAVSPAQRPPAGVAVEVRPVRRPQQVPGWSEQFLLDVHLGTLARRLRLLGLDTAYRNDVDDDALIEQAQCQRRLLLTQDRGLLRRRALWAGAYVRGARPTDQLTDVLERFAPALAPFTRCTTCNGEVEPVPKHEVAHKLRPGTRRCYQAYARCRCCGQVYWSGAHGRRLGTIVTMARSVRDQAATSRGHEKAYFKRAPTIRPAR